MLIFNYILSRWDEAILSALRDEGIEINYVMKPDGRMKEDPHEDEEEEELDEEMVHVQVKSRHEESWMSLKRFLKKESNKNRHEYIRENVLNLTRIFNQRVKAFIREVVLAKGSPMCVQRFTYKTEFQNRGAAHVHGVLWVNMNKMERLCQLRNGELVSEAQLSQEKIKKKIQRNRENIQDIKENKPFKGLKKAFTKLRTGEPLSYDQRKVVSRFVDATTTVSLCPAEVGEEAVRIAAEVNQHSHTKTCRLIPSFIIIHIG